VTSLLLDARLGSRKPRVSSVPAYRSSAGQEAVDLAATAGLFLDPWQQDVLIGALGEGRGGLWTAPDVGLVVPRQNGKGAVLEARELAGLFLFGESILHTSHEFKTSMDHYRRLERLIRNTPDLHRKVDSYPKAPGTEGIVLRDGRALRFMARTKGSGRGFPADVVIIDEAFAATDEQLSALMPTQQSKPNAQTWYTSSPPLDGETGEPLFAMRARGESGDPDLAWFDWGAEMGVDPDSVDQWYATNPAMGYRLTERGMSSMRKKLSADDFSRECLGVWPKTSREQWLVVPQRDWLAASAVFDHPSQIAFAVVLSTDRKWATICGAGPIGDGLVGVVVVDRREGTGWVVGRLQQLIERWKPVAVVIDKGSPAKSLADDAEAARIELAPITTRDVAGAAGAFYDGIAGRPSRDPDTGEWGRDPRVVRHRDQDELTAAVAAAPKRNLATTWAFDQMATDVDITPVIGCANALWAYTTHPQQFFAGKWA